MLVSRRIREANFRRAILAAYDDTCAVTGIASRTVALYAARTAHLGHNALSAGLWPRQQAMRSEAGPLAYSKHQLEAVEFVGVEVCSTPF